MKKLILFLLLPLLVLGQVETGQQQDLDYGMKIPIDTLQTVTTPSFIATFGNTGVIGKIPAAYIATTQTMNDSLAKKLNISDLPANLTLYPTTTASDVSGYVVLVKDIHDPRYNTTAVDVSTPAITGTAQLISQRISDAGILTGNPGVFNVTTFGNIRKLSGSGTAQFYFEVYHRDSAGTETLICTSSISSEVVNGTYAEFSASGIWDNGAFDSTDRIVIKSYANRITGGSDPVYQFQFGGTAPVRTVLPVPFNVLAGEYEVKANKSDSYTTSSSTTYSSTKALVDGLAIKANDTNVVHKTGNEVISGNKNFTGSILGTSANFSGTFTVIDPVNPYNATTKNYVDNLLALKANQSTTYTKSEVDSKISNLNEAYHVDFIDSGSHDFTVPSDVIIQNVYLNNIPVYGEDWSQTGASISVSTAQTGDKVTLTGGNFVSTDLTNYTTKEDLFESNFYPQYTDSQDINQKIIGLFLENTDPTKSYYLKEFSHRIDGFNVCLIFDNTNTEVCRYVTNTIINNGEYRFLSESNSSGITGYLIPNESEFFNFNPINKLLNKSLITKKFDLNILKEEDYPIDITIRKNKLNPKDLMYKSSYVYDASNPGFIKKEASDFFTALPYFFIKDNESIVLSNNSLVQCDGYLVDKSKKILKNLNLDANPVVLNDTGEDCFFAGRVRYTGLFDGNYPQLEYGSVATDYEAYMELPILENKFEVVLPKNNYFNIGDVYNFYKKNILNISPIFDLNTIISSTGDSNLRSYPRQITGNPSTVINAKMTFENRFNKKVVSKSVRNFITKAKQTGTINVLPIGDSFTNINIWDSFLRELAIDDGITYNTIGLKSPISKNENQTGGTLKGSFIDNRGKAFKLGVTAFTNDPISDGFGATIYKDSNNFEYFFDGRKLNSSLNGVIRVAPNGHNNAPPSNSTLTKVNGNGPATIAYTTVVEINRNPFLNGSNQLDFQYYLQGYGFESEFDLTNQKFVLAIQFSWNDNSDYYNPSNVASVVASFKTIIDKFHEQYPDAFVIIGIEPSANITGGGMDTMDRITGVHTGRMEFAKGIIAQFETNDYEDFVFVNPTYAYVDLENGFQTEQVNLSEDYPAVFDTRVLDGVHCNEAGMKQIGRSYYPIIQHILGL